MTLISKRSTIAAAALLSLPVLAGVAAANGLGTSELTPSDAKLVIAPMAAETPTSSSDQAAYAAYWDAGYSYGQLLALADEWHVTDFEAKARAGNAVLAHDTATLSVIDAITPVELGADEPTVDANQPLYIIENDAEWSHLEALAAEWNVDTVSAKARLAAMPPADADILVGRS